ncbi:MAG: zf-HC2 domain-containing protein [Anaerolineales bacterium]
MHLTDDLLNEYLDNEAAERAQIESHLASCADCAARLTALQALFAELDSLPEVELTHSLASRITLHAASPLELPRWLTLTAISQAAFALLLLLVAAPFVMNLLPAIEAPSFAEVLIQLQTQWLTLFNSFTNYQLPSLPTNTTISPNSHHSLSTRRRYHILLWLVGNGLLLRRQIK